MTAKRFTTVATFSVSGQTTAKDAVIRDTALRWRGYCSGRDTLSRFTVALSAKLPNSM
jgi:hypothetical protein